MSGKSEKKADPPAVLFRSTGGWAAAALLSAPAVLLLWIPGFPPMAAAQATAAVIGLGGGLSCAAAIRAAGGQVDRKSVLFLAAVWCLSCVLGVTPLFFTMGTPLEMTVNAFYCFALCGALGGGLTAYRMKSLFPDGAGWDAIPSVFLWTLGFGLASVATNIVGEGLQRVLPAGAAWFVAYEIMALVVGAAGGCAVVWFQRRPQTQRDTPGQADWDESAGGGLVRPVAVAVMLCLPFYLNDLNDIFVEDWRCWLAIDYTAVKLLPLLVLAWLISRKEAGLSSLGLRMTSAASFWGVLSVGFLSAAFIEQNSYLLTGLLPGAPLGKMPEIISPVWRWVDLTLGLAMVGVVEELVFRGYLRLFLFRYTRRNWLVILVSAMAFGFIHWGGGVQKVVSASAIGAVFMALYLRTRSLPAIMAAHYLVNFVAFSNVVAPSIFRFF